MAGSGPAFPLTLNAALGEKQEVIDRQADGSARARCEDTGHRPASGDALEGKADQRGDVVSQHDPALTRCPFEDCRVVSAGQTSILNARDVEVGETPKKTTDDVGVEVLVRCKAKHRTNGPTCAWPAVVP
jgi:hypothetical protein